MFVYDQEPVNSSYSPSAILTIEEVKKLEQRTLIRSFDQCVRYTKSNNVSQKQEIDLKAFINSTDDLINIGEYDGSIHQGRLMILKTLYPDLINLIDEEITTQQLSYLWKFLYGQSDDTGHPFMLDHSEDKEFQRKKAVGILVKYWRMVSSKLRFEFFIGPYEARIIYEEENENRIIIRLSTTYSCVFTMTYPKTEEEEMCHERFNLDDIEEAIINRL